MHRWSIVWSHLLVIELFHDSFSDYRKDDTSFQFKLLTLSYRKKTDLLWRLKKAVSWEIKIVEQRKQKS